MNPWCVIVCRTVMQTGQQFRFQTPSSILVVGPSGCGKTMFTEKLLLDNKDLFETPPTQVHYCYGAWQDRFQAMQEQGVVLHEGIPDHQALVQWFPQGQGVLVLDDLMDEGSHDKHLLDLFTKHSHHQNVMVLYLCQDMFPVGKYAKSISRNAHYIVAFKNPLDQLGVRNVLLQSFPTTWKDSLETFHQATTRPYGYLMLDLHPASSDQQHLLSHLLKNEGWTTPSTLALLALDTPSRSQQATPPRTLNQADLQRRLRMMLQDQEQLAQGREIANVTMTNSIVTSYKQGGGPTVESTSSRYSS